jgi:hypothetical protein
MRQHGPTVCLHETIVGMDDYLHQWPLLHLVVVAIAITAV